MVVLPPSCSARRSSSSAVFGRRGPRCWRPKRLCPPLQLPADPLDEAALHQPLERVNREIDRRTDVVGIFPNDRSLIGLATSVVIEQNDEWLGGRRYLSAHSLDTVLDQENETDQTREEVPELTAA